jgi:hypothetical protein
MAHTTILPKNWIVLHDGDPEGGTVTFRRNGPDGMPDGPDSDHEIPYEVVFNFVAEMVRRRRISRLEDAAPEEILE